MPLALNRTGVVLRSATWPPTGRTRYRRAAPRLGCVRTAHGSPADPPARTWAAADPPGGGCWPTRPTRTARSGPTCADGGSRQRSGEERPAKGPRSRYSPALSAGTTRRRQRCPGQDEGHRLAPPRGHRGTGEQGHSQCGAERARCDSPDAVSQPVHVAKGHRPLYRDRTCHGFAGHSGSHLLGTLPGAPSR